MITRLGVENFKCFRNDAFELSALTLLTGVNGSGKSSLIQALLLTHQAATQETDFVRLNGPHQLQLGRAADVLNVSGPDQKTIKTALEFPGEGRFDWVFEAVNPEALVLGVVHRPASLTEHAVEFASHLTYLSAERLGPRDVLSMDAAPASTVGVGSCGEYTAQVLLDRERETVRKEVRHPTTSEGGFTFLAKQVELWMRDLVPGVEIRAQAFEGTNTVAVRMRRGTLEWLRPTNMAFGATYALPIVVAGLLAPAGGVIVVDSPELHLHPAAQSKMGAFLARIASAGVQVIAETHSDHVLNGVRVGVADSSHPLKSDQVVLQHFWGAHENGELATAIRIAPNGSLSAWPETFFDQSERDLARLVRMRRDD